MRKILTAMVFLSWGTAATAEEVVIAALGDSLTQGYGLPQEQGLVPQLQDWLEAEGASVRLINAGVSGDTTAGGAARVAWTLTPDVDGMIVTLGGNDLLRGIDPEVARSNIETILQTARDADVAVLLVGMSAPGNFGPDYKAAFDAIYPELSAAYGTLYVADFFAGFGSVEADQIRALMQGDGIHPNAEGVARIVGALGPEVLKLVEQAAE